MSDQPDDQSTEEVTEPAADEPLAAWQEPADGPAWSNIDEAEASAAGSAEPAAAEPVAAPEEAPTEVTPPAEGAPSRRPTSLRDQYVKDSDSVPRRKLDPPPFASAPAFPGSPVAPPVSEPEQPGNPGHVPKPASLLGRIPTDRIPTDRLSMDNLPLDKLSMDNVQVDKLRSLVKQRPEVGLGLAFAGGLVIATILKRFGRR